MISQKECKSVERLTLHLDLAKFFLSCSETVAWMFLSLCFPVIQQCSRAFLVEYWVQGESKSEKNKQSTMVRKVKVVFEKIFWETRAQQRRRDRELNARSVQSVETFRRADHQQLLQEKRQSISGGSPQAPKQGSLFTKQGKYRNPGKLISFFSRLFLKPGYQTQNPKMSNRCSLVQTMGQCGRQL